MVWYLRIINEPIQGSIYHSIREFLFPNMNSSQTNQKVDDQKIIFFEPGATDLISAGFKDTPGGQEFRDREAYIYLFDVDDYSLPQNEQVCNYMDSFYFATKDGVANILGVGKFMTELGAILDTPEEKRNQTTYQTQWNSDSLSLGLLGIQVLC
ncbi:unnamed protein product (macronuclear) [Paramecium tetraurelia]|uniref:Uncharacterized protein n=1 Tax=Paramecium tetraurelia TaxID=5888 RepID=A0BFM5_PARTE|nr:uncharacterized protein GSPATT00028377001 [Paramecium tetraurelia]CAK57342.1 unnamed protein product [Paramecium tetraurelia]|eukprot:XP_001424740.1 hypothetical protein (macronuclear) [Paramecium tetraurelia strain d4-2]